MEHREFGPFKLQERIGVGGMGEVYRAFCPPKKRALAVKILSPASMASGRTVERFVREVTLLKRFKHPNIVRCYGGGSAEGRHFLVMEYVSGGSLSSFLSRRGKLPWETVVEFGLQICHALEYAHDQGVIHRDLKPGNLLLTDDQQIKLVDFGLARVLYESGLTATHHTVGTSAYMAPEQIRGGEVTHKTDLYALGCVLYRMLTGELPFRAQNTAEMLFHHVSTKAPRAAVLALDCPVWLDTLVGQLLEKDPAARPRDAWAVALALEEVEQRAAAQSGAFEHAVSGEPSILARAEGASSLAARKLLPQRSRKQAGGPFYESAWFLALCLCLVVGLGIWVLMPPGEEKLFARAQALMATGDEADMLRARREFLEPLLARFPDGPRAAQARQWIDDVDMRQAEDRLQLNVRLGRPPKSEGERLLAEAWRYEQFGDRVTAEQKYRALLEVLPDEPAQHAYLLLARRQLSALEADAAPADRAALVQAALAQADERYAAGDVVGANKLWQSVVDLYATNKELTPLVQQAQSRLHGLHTAESSAAAPADDASAAAPDGPARPVATAAEGRRPAEADVRGTIPASH